ncbi:hypothetical protein RI367_002193 [Sorochytrium milnesiophthora]
MALATIQQIAPYAVYILNLQTLRIVLPYVTVPLPLAAMLHVSRICHDLSRVGAQGHGLRLWSVLTGRPPGWIVSNVTLPAFSVVYFAFFHGPVRVSGLMQKLSPLSDVVLTIGEGVNRALAMCALGIDGVRSLAAAGNAAYYARTPYGAVYQELGGSVVACLLCGTLNGCGGGLLDGMFHFSQRAWTISAPEALVFVGFDLRLSFVTSSLYMLMVNGYIHEAFVQGVPEAGISGTLLARASCCWVVVGSLLWKRFSPRIRSQLRRATSPPSVKFPVSERHDNVMEEVKTRLEKLAKTSRAHAIAQEDEDDAASSSSDHGSVYEKQTSATDTPSRARRRRAPKYLSTPECLRQRLVSRAWTDLCSLVVGRRLLLQYRSAPLFSVSVVVRPDISAWQEAPATLATVHYAMSSYDHMAQVAILQPLTATGPCVVQDQQSAWPLLESCTLRLEVQLHMDVADQQRAQPTHPLKALTPAAKFRTISLCSVSSSGRIYPDQFLSIIGPSMLFPSPDARLEVSLGRQQQQTITPVASLPVAHDTALLLLSFTVSLSYLQRFFSPGGALPRSAITPVVPVAVTASVAARINPYLPPAYHVLPADDFFLDPVFTAWASRAASAYSDEEQLAMLVSLLTHWKRSRAAHRKLFGSCGMFRKVKSPDHQQPRIAATAPYHTPRKN